MAKSVLYFVKNGGNRVCAALMESMPAAEAGLDLTVILKSIFNMPRNQT